MPSSILNSDDGVISGTAGLKNSGGDDGILNIQSNGATVAVVNGSGVTVTGTLGASGGYGAVSATTLTVNSNNISADNSLGFRNRIINGDMRIDQRNAGASVTVNTGSEFFPVDRFIAAGQTSDGVFTVQRSTTTPSGFTNSLLVTVTTADASISAAQTYFLQQKIEGFNFADVGFGTASAKTVTLSFFVRSSVTGTFSGALANGAYDRSYPFTYTISSANIYEYKTITIEGDTSGVYLTNNGMGLRVLWNLGSGVDNTGTADAWVGAGNVGADSTVALISTLNATWFVTGVQLEVGEVATPFERRPFGAELILCQRYFEKNEPGATNGVYAMGYSSANNAARYVLFFKTTKRATPTISVSGATHFFGQTGAGSNVATATLGGSLASLNQTGLSATFAGASFTVGQGSQLLDNNSGNSSISASAEL